MWIILIIALNASGDPIDGQYYAPKGKFETLPQCIQGIKDYRKDILNKNDNHWPKNFGDISCYVEDQVKKV